MFKRSRKFNSRSYERGTNVLASCFGATNCVQVSDTRRLVPVYGPCVAAISYMQLVAR